MKKCSYIVLFHCLNADSARASLHYSTYRSKPERTTSITSIFCNDRREHISATAWPTKEKSPSDCTELEEMQR